MYEKTSIFAALGLDEDELEWTDLALCRGMSTDLFYDDYDNEQISHMVDEGCLSCPVIKQCALAGINNNETGVWGGVYLNAGKPDPNKNKYKTPETWKEIKERLSE